MILTDSYIKAQGFESLDEIQKWVMLSILKYGDESQPRGMPTLELCPVTFTLYHPRKRCIANPQRRWNLPLAIGEFCWHFSGSNEVKFIEYYGKRWREFAEDGSTIPGSCYGHKIFKRKIGKFNQWERVVQLLRADQHSRRAVLHFSDAESTLNAYAKDVACASSLQFMIRSGQLHAFAHMRSNDAMWGLPYDVFFFTMLQELLALELGVELGTYSHFAASMHLYERHIKLAKSITESREQKFYEMPSMQEHNQVNKFLELESKLRTGERTNVVLEAEVLHMYWKDLLSVLDWYSILKRTNEAPEPPENSPYLPLLRNTISKARGKY